jgi:hypothetical protein
VNDFIRNEYYKDTLQRAIEKKKKDTMGINMEVATETEKGEKERDIKLPKDKILGDRTANGHRKRRK